jgi:hypothetical protein
MNIRKLPAFVALVVVTIFVFPVAGQQKRADKPTPKPAVAAPTPAPTFETLIPADSFKIYGEVRGVGQLVRSSAFSETLEPVLKLASPPKEFKSMVNWLEAHAEDVMTSRLLVAAWPNGSNLPDTIVAVELPSAEEATKLERELNELLPKVLPPVPSAGPAPQPGGAAKPPTAEPQQHFSVLRAGSLLLITEKPLNLKVLKPAGSKPLFADPNFRVARNRFGSEQVFVYLDMHALEREEEEQRKKYEEENKKVVEEARRKREEEQKKTAAEKAEEAENEPPPPAEPEQRPGVVNVEGPVATTSTTIVGVKDSPSSDQISSMLSTVGAAFFEGQSQWPDAVGFALSLESDSFDVKALLINAPGERGSAVPFIPMLITGPAIVPESPTILPANTELTVTMSLDFPQIYAELAKPRPSLIANRTANNVLSTFEGGPVDSPFTALEKQLKIKVKDELLPLLGSEVVLCLPVGSADIIGLSRQSSAAKEDEAAKPVTAIKAPVVAIAVRDKEGMRKLLPKLIEGLGFKGAMSLAQTERREDTEVVSLMNVVPYAFVGNFLVLSSDSASIRYIVDAYLKHETLSGEISFKNYTRWQPRILQGQIYVSPALMESYKKWAESPGPYISEQVRAFLTRLTVVSQPVTYSLSNEGFGPFHELHLPRNLVLMAVAGISGETNPPPEVQNERRAMSGLWMIAYAEVGLKEKGGAYVPLEQLIADQKVSKEIFENTGYKFEVVVSGDDFEVTAVPIEYGKSGKMSFFIDKSRVLRAADHAGAAATVNDPPR